jgi:uroporphyrinogen-III decarboxylase
MTFETRYRMNSKERMKLAMAGLKPDRIPVMCQLSAGHMYKNAGIGPVDFWYTAEGLGEGYLTMAERYKFDGILFGYGIDPEIRNCVVNVDAIEGGHTITWSDGVRTFLPYDDDPRELIAKRREVPFVSIDDIEVESVKARYAESSIDEDGFNLARYVMERKGAELSMHFDFGTSFERFLRELGSFENGLMALADDPEKCLEIIEVLNKYFVSQALQICSIGIDALKLSSPLASASFISRRSYEIFVLPFERQITDAVHEGYPDVPCYTHTCGKIGDRLDLMLMTGLDGIECLDPPPLGDVVLESAVDQIGDKVFIKGNLDSVNELYGHTPVEVKEICRKRIEIGKRSTKGFILSSACSVSPKAPPENVEMIYEAVMEYGQS